MSKKTTPDTTPEAADMQAMQAELEELKAANAALEVEAQKARLAAEEAERLKAEAEAALEDAAQTGGTENTNTGAAIKDSPVKVKVYCKLPGGMRFPLPDGSVAHFAGAGSKDAVLGLGVTPNVAYPVWEYVKNTYGKIPAFAKGLIFAMDNASGDMGEVQEKSGEKSGFEGVDPKKPGQGITPLKSK